MAKIGDTKQEKVGKKTDVWKLVDIKDPSEIPVLEARLADEESRDITLEYDLMASNQQENIRVLKKEIKRLKDGFFNEIEEGGTSLTYSEMLGIIDKLAGDKLTK